uniref:hypothetical protein n=1 Tax=Limnobacter sp. TaxID=2003368 RepID=UPI0039BC3C1C|nr:hypothetical protein [Burkholderiales bacterium]
RIAMIWLSVNLDCFIAELSSSMVENSTSDPVYLQGVLPDDLVDDGYVKRLRQRERIKTKQEF